VVSFAVLFDHWSLTKYFPLLIATGASPDVCLESQFGWKLLKKPLVILSDQ
jgi:hypothetical protein